MICNITWSTVTCFHSVPTHFREKKESMDYLKVFVAKMALNILNLDTYLVSLFCTYISMYKVSIIKVCTQTSSSKYIYDNLIRNCKSMDPCLEIKLKLALNKFK